MSQKRNKELSAPNTGALPLERNRYFTGKYMTARDFAGEQEYHLSRQRLHNRLLHGWGIVCGLRVEEHPKPECKDSWVTIKAGVAIDCYGREIYLPEDIAVEITRDIPPPGEFDEGDDYEDQPSGESDEGYEDEEGENGEHDHDHHHHYDHGRGHGRHGGPRRHRRRHRPKRRRPSDDSEFYEREGWHGDNPYLAQDIDGLLVCIRYKEVEIEPVPALYAEGQCDPKHHEANRIRESYEIVFLTTDEVDADCWRTRGGDWDASCRDDCDKPITGPSGSCVDVKCPCHGVVPLALLYTWESDDDGETVPPAFYIDLDGRRHLATPSHYLTHIVGINWPHGGEVTLHQLRHEMNSELRIAFDRKLEPADGIATGINRRTFTVEFGGITRNMEFLPSPEDNEAHLAEDGCTAVYPIAHEYLTGRDNISNSFVYITLRCDFVKDCHDIPVDGNYLRGRLPSGDGRPGGEFVSWFRVVNKIGEGY